MVPSEITVFFARLDQNCGKGQYTFSVVDPVPDADGEWADDGQRGTAYEANRNDKIPPGTVVQIIGYPVGMFGEYRFFYGSSNG